MGRADAPGVRQRTPATRQSARLQPPQGSRRLPLRRPRGGRLGGRVGAPGPILVGAVARIAWLDARAAEARERGLRDGLAMTPDASFGLRRAPRPPRDREVS